MLSVRWKRLKQLPTGCTLRNGDILRQLCLDCICDLVVINVITLLDNIASFIAVSIRLLPSAEALMGFSWRPPYLPWLLNISGRASQISPSVSPSPFQSTSYRTFRFEIVVSPISWILQRLFWWNSPASPLSYLSTKRSTWNHRREWLFDRLMASKFRSYILCDEASMNEYRTANRPIPGWTTKLSRPECLLWDSIPIEMNRHLVIWAWISVIRTWSTISRWHRYSHGVEDNLFFKPAYFESLSADGVGVNRLIVPTTMMSQRAAPCPSAATLSSGSFPHPSEQTIQSW